MPVHAQYERSFSLARFIVCSFVTVIPHGWSSFTKNRAMLVARVNFNHANELSRLDLARTTEIDQDLSYVDTALLAVVQCASSLTFQFGDGTEKDIRDCQ